MTPSRALRLPKTSARGAARELAVWTFADVANAEEVRAAVREWFSSISANRPVTSGLGNSSCSNRAKRIASSASDPRVARLPELAL